ncbi:MAG: anti-sigma factor, partial [Sphingobacterium sp.]
MTEDNQREQAQKLLKKYLRGECNPDEERIVTKWFFSIDEELTLPKDEREVLLGRSKDVLMHKFEGEMDKMKPNKN